METFQARVSVLESPVLMRSQGRQCSAIEGAAISSEWASNPKSVQHVVQPNTCSSVQSLPLTS